MHCQCLFICLGRYAYPYKRLFVNKKIYDDFVPKFLDEVKTLKMGDPLREETRLGPMIDEQSAQRIESWVNEAVNGGCSAGIWGRRKGTLYEPTILTKTTPQMKVNRNELFAPAVTVSSMTPLKRL